MWKIIPDSNSPEPEALRNLKQLLAKNVCNCEICSYEKPLLSNNKQIQVTNQDFFNTLRYTVSTHNLYRTQSQTFKKNVCPGCYMAMNFCHQRDLKFLKDEESEINTEMFSRDKSTDKRIEVLEKSTSDTNKIEFKNAIVSFKDDFSRQQLIADDIKVKKEPVIVLDCQEGTSEIIPTYGNCLCMDNFINSIRPPLTNHDVYDT